jgi:hypothetical protein
VAGIFERLEDIAVARVVDGQRPDALNQTRME